MTNEEAKEYIRNFIAIDGYEVNLTDDFREALFMAIRALEQPSVTEFADKCKECGKMLNEKLQTRWIPCSERLPEDDGWYLCTIKNETEIKVAQIRFFEDKGWKAYGHRVLAWMNEPTPYKESDEE